MMRMAWFSANSDVPRQRRQLGSATARPRLEGSCGPHILTRKWTMLSVSRADHSWGRWLLVAVAALLLTACHGPETQFAGNGQPAVVSSLALAPESTVPANGVPANGVPANGVPANLSLSDHTNSLPKSPRPILDPQVALTQHTTIAPPNAPGAAPSHATPPAAHPSTAIPASVTAVTSMPNAAMPAQVQSVVQVTPGYALPSGSACPQPYYPQPCGPQPCGPDQTGPEPWCPNGVPCSGWRPPGLPCPWPDDEYLCDGGDKIPSVRVRQDWSVDGLELEDTIVHFDTLNGETHVEPSNRVCVYAPRFASVRKVYGILQHDHLDRIAKVDQPIPVEGLGDVQIATTSIQPVQPVLSYGASTASGIRENTPPIGLDNREGLVGLQGNELPYEDTTNLQRKMLTNSEKARLADLLQAASVWAHDTAVQVVIDNIAAHEDIGVSAAESVHIYSLEGKSRLRVCKLASTKEARPGETVEFTLQFENIGDQTIGNVTVIDNLTTRLEYVESSQTSSLHANFSSADNQGESLTLRWEIVEPMKVGEGGVIRFTCRVR